MISGAAIAAGFTLIMRKGGVKNVPTVVQENA